MDLKSLIRDVPDYPSDGILFRDLTPLMANPEAMHYVTGGLSDHLRALDTRAIAAIDSRGFIFGAPVAAMLGIPFIPIRKAGKLPGGVVGVDYQLEYGTDRMEMHADAISEGDKVLLIDDLIATGGTAAAAVELIRGVGGTVVEACFVIDLPDLGGAERLRSLGCDCFSLCEFEGE